MNGRKAKQLRKVTSTVLQGKDWPQTDYNMINQHMVSSKDLLGQVRQVLAHTLVLGKCQRKFYKLLKRFTKDANKIENALDNSFTSINMDNS